MANCISVFAGSPVIKKLIKERGEGMTKVLKCAAEGFPRPTVQWSGNGSNVSHSYNEDFSVPFLMFYMLIEAAFI